MKSQSEKDPPVLGGVEEEQGSGEIKVKVQSIDPESQTVPLEETLQKVQNEKEQVSELTERLKEMEVSHARDLEDMAQEVNICAEETQQAQDEMQQYKELASQWETEAQIRGNMLAELRGQAGGMAATMDPVPRTHSFHSNEDSVDFDSTLMSESQEELRALQRRMKKMEVERGIQVAKIKGQARKLALMELREAKRSSRGGTTRPGIDRTMSMKDIDMMGKSLLQVDDEVQDLNEELVSKDKTIQSLDKRVKKREATIQKLEEENETLRKQFKVFEQMKTEMDESKKEREGMTLAMKKIASKMEKKENRIKELEKEIYENLETTELMEEDMEKQNQHIFELEDTIDEKEDQINTLRGEVSETLTKIDEMYDERDGKGSLISGLKNQVIELSEKKKHTDAVHSAQLFKMVGDQKKLEEVIEGLRKDVSERDLSIENMEDERSSTLASTEEQLAGKQAQIEELEQKVEASSLEITKLQEEINSVASERNSFDANLSRLNELEAERDAQIKTLDDLYHELESTVHERDIAKAKAAALLGKVAHQTKRVIELEKTEIETNKKIKVMEGELNEFHRDKIQWEMFNAGLQSISDSGKKGDKSKKKDGEPNVAQMTAAFTASAAKVHSLQEELSLGRSRIREMEVEYETNTADELEEMGNLHDRMVVEVSRCREELVRLRHYLAEYKSRNILLEQERKAKPIKAAEFYNQMKTMKRKLAVAEAQTMNLTSEIASFMLSYKCQRCDHQDKADQNFQEEKKESNRGVSSMRVDRNEIQRDEAKSPVR